jgi:hypothetical protein
MSSIWDTLFGRRAESDESCKKQLEKLEERIQKLELDTVERNLQVLDAAERVAAKLKERVRKREDVVQQPERPARPWELKRGLQSNEGTR